jgi:hypothetical protein
MTTKTDIGDRMNLMALRPSQWKRLEEDLTNPVIQQDFLDGLHAYLNSVALDDGVDTDRLYVTAVKTNNAGAWTHIDHARLVALLHRVDNKVASVFLSGVSKALEAKLRPLVCLA